MAPVIDQVVSALSKRCAYGQYELNGICYNQSGFYYYGRWVLAAVVIVFILFVFFLYSFIRRRRSRGQPPMYGTGWMPYQRQQYNNNQQQAYYPPPPAYGARPDNYNMAPQREPNDVYRGQDAGVEVPKSTYHGDYAPPSSPPPRK